MLLTMLQCRSRGKRIERQKKSLGAEQEIERLEFSERECHPHVCWTSISLSMQLSINLTSMNVMTGSFSRVCSDSTYAVKGFGSSTRTHPKPHQRAKFLEKLYWHQPIDQLFIQRMQSAFLYHAMLPEAILVRENGLSGISIISRQSG